MKKHTPKVSVIMPAYNAANYIIEAIVSIIQQTETDFELLICDDGSTDATLAIINSQTKHDQRIRVFKNHENIGNLKTTNFLFSECKGEFITIQDADDYCTPNRLEVLLLMFERDPQLGMVGSQYVTVDKYRRISSQEALILKDVAIKHEMRKQVIPMLYGSIMVRSSVVKRVGNFRLFFNRIGYADLDWLNRCGEYCKVENCDDVLYFYRKHKGSFTHNAVRDSLILQNMHMLLLKAHKSRLKSGKDFFQTNDKKAMKNFISDYYVKRAENEFWDNNFIESMSKLLIAFRANPSNRLAYKTLFYIVRKTFIN